MAAGKTIGGINVTITATIDKFAKQMALAQRLVKNFTGGVKNLVFSMKGLAVAFAGGALVKFTANQFKAVDALGELSDKTGVSTKKLAGFQMAARDAGVSNALLERSLTTLATKGMTLEGWIDDTSKLSKGQEQLAATTEMFGKKGADMVRILQGGRKALEAAREAAESTGMAIGRSAVMGVERAVEAYDKFKDSVGGVFRAMAVKSAPYVEFFANKATNWLSKDGNGAALGGMIVDTIGKTASFVADTIAKMAAGVLRAMGDIGFFIGQVREGAPSWMGIGFSDNNAKLNYMADLGKNFYSPAQAMTGANLPSNAINSWVADVQKKVAELVAEMEASRGGVLSRTMSNIGRMSAAAMKPGLGNVKQLGGDAMGFLGGLMRSAPMAMIRGQLAANGFDFDKVKNERGSLAFAESGSADSYRQQAAIRRQNDTLKLQKDQLKVEQKIEQHLAAIKGFGPLPVAGL